MAAHPIARGCHRLATSYVSSAARAFLQLAPRRSFHNSSGPLLDFLLPNVSPRRILHDLSSLPSTKLHVSGKQGFTTSAVRRHTSAVFNPRKDEDGNDMTVEITPRASNVRMLLSNSLAACSQYSASKRNYVCGRKSKSGSPDPSRKRRLPRFPIFDVSHDSATARSSNVWLNRSLNRWIK